LIKKGIEILELPLEEKLKIEMANNKHFLGYARLGTEITALKPDYREQFDVSMRASFILKPPAGADKKSSSQQKSRRLDRTSLRGTT
jgi:isopenicillin N synthase-like dioxygenase